MKRTAVLFPLVLLAFSRAPHAQAPKIGVFDAARVSSETELGKAVTRRLNGLQEQKKNDIAARGKAVKDLQSQLETQGLSLSSEKRTALEKDIQRKSLELNQAQEAARSELQLEYTEEQEKFHQKLTVAIEELSRDASFTLILEKGSTAYADPAVDVTTTLVDKFNRLFPAPPSEPAKAENKKK